MLMRSIPFLVAWALLAVVAGPTVAEAGMQWQLLNHDDGNQADPLYGLRLDGLFARDSDHVFTFDFEHESIDPWKRMKLEFIDNGEDDPKVILQGFVYGGQDGGEDYVDNEYLGEYEVYFAYTAGITSTTNILGDLTSLTVEQNQADNRGWIKGPGSDGTEFSLVDQADRSGNSFFLDFDQGHRGVTPAGWGWLNHAVKDSPDEDAHLQQHLYSSDWLFALGDDPVPPPPNPVPEPGSLAIFAISSLGLCVMARRRRKS